MPLTLFTVQALFAGAPDAAGQLEGQEEGEDDDEEEEEWASGEVRPWGRLPQWLAAGDSPVVACRCQPAGAPLLALPTPAACCNTGRLVDAALPASAARAPPQPPDPHPSCHVASTGFFLFLHGFRTRARTTRTTTSG